MTVQAAVFSKWINLDYKGELMCLYILYCGNRTQSRLIIYENHIKREYKTFEKLRILIGNVSVAWYYLMISITFHLKWSILFYRLWFGSVSDIVNINHKFIMKNDNISAAIASIGMLSNLLWVWKSDGSKPTSFKINMVSLLMDIYHLHQGLHVKHQLEGETEEERSTSGFLLLLN